MRAGIAAALGGSALAGALAWWRIAATKGGVESAVAGDSALAREAAAKASSATTPAEVKAAAEKAREAVGPSPALRAEADQAVADAAKATTPTEVKAAAAKVVAVAEKAAKNATIALRLTTYWPFTAKEGEKKMEGGVNDRKGRPLHTLEDFLAGKSDHVSLSGDDAAWPYGQKVTFSLSDGKKVVGRVTDTGRNFRGATKLQRVVGREPLDVCVYAKSTKVPADVTGEIDRGNHRDKKGREIATGKFQGQTVAVGGALDLLGCAA